MKVRILELLDGEIDRHIALGKAMPEQPMKKAHVEVALALMIAKLCVLAVAHGA